MFGVIFRRISVIEPNLRLCTPLLNKSFAYSSQSTPKPLKRKKAKATDSTVSSFLIDLIGSRRSTRPNTFKAQIIIKSTFHFHSKWRHFVDLRHLRTVGGSGGDGAISFMQIMSNDKAGPDGGDGGNGNLKIESLKISELEETLNHFSFPLLQQAVMLYSKHQTMSTI